MRFTVGNVLQLAVVQKSRRIAGLESDERHNFFCHGENRAPRAAADDELRVAAPPDAPRAMRRRIAGEQFKQARAKINLPVGAQPFGLRLGQRRKADGKLRRRGERRGDFVRPAAAGVGKGVERGDVRFDVEDRRAVHKVTFAQD